MNHVYSDSSSYMSKSNSSAQYTTLTWDTSAPTQRQQTTLLTMNHTLFREHSESTICVSVSIDSRGRTIHNAHHISLHSSSDTAPTHQSPHKLHIRHNCSSSSANQLHRTASHYGLVHTVYINLLQRNVIRALHTIYHTCEALQ